MGESGKDRVRRWRPVALSSPQAPSVEELLRQVGRGDQAAFASLFDAVIGKVLGLASRVLRNPQLAEEVAQEVMVQVWRTAARFDAERGSGLAWVLTLTHRRAVDRVRAEQALTDRTERVAAMDAQVPHDQVAEAVSARLDREQVRRCLGRLTDLQREAVTLAYYEGYTYRQVAERLDAPLPTIKSRMRDGLIRMRDCLGVTMGERA
ncbi:ECF RNA polymerase sigma factor SigK [Micromonospora endophytica]|uniref:RNA polymerase subunit sigma n=1 Tax=Micromonospora endophytica TaxID=515350 RepID=A0A2W2CMZ0_9ACTN|nr:ECF RNA polymerase sigma factor SigK [Micromonospora endophytica]PZG00816.1 RNA polymerase subunit sigma [Micromonospora endophytica]RIW42060.1 sigma-70 family RNA polymerase sigma factor [Micromonospora endophytica]BCJ59676.1 RNA polymerase sigma factor SigK [Micromonospora endophytica]